MEIQMVVAVSRTGCIGDEGRVPWEYPDDVRQYKRRVRGTTVVVGRTTFDLMNVVTDEETLVVTRSDRTSDDDRVRYVGSRREALDRAERGDPDTVSVIGGGAIYRLFAPVADRAFVSELPETLDGDAYFPYLGAGWTEADRTAYDRFELVEYGNTDPIAHDAA